MKKIISILILSFFVFSCGSVKKSSTETEIKKDSVAKKETSITENESGKKVTTINYKASTFTFEPIDAQIPYFVDGKEYKGVKVTNKVENEDKKIIEEYQKQINTLIDEITQLKEDLRHEQDNKYRDNAQALNVIGNKIILLAVILFVLYFILNYIKNKNPLT